MADMDVTITLDGLDYDGTAEYVPSTNVPASNVGNPDRWTPDESEAAEITAVNVTLTEDDDTLTDVLSRLSAEEVAALTEKANNEGQDEGGDWGHDPYDEYYDR